MAYLLRPTTFLTRSLLNEFDRHSNHLWKRSLCTSLIKFSQSSETLRHNADAPIHTIQEVKANLSKIMGVRSGYRPIQESRSHLLSFLPQSQAELEPRAMQDSFASALIPLSTDGELQDRYITFLGSVRLGRLLEDMDIFAVWVVHKHIKNPKETPDMPSPHTLVTVLVDKIDFTDFKPTPYDDIRLSGHVSWVGKSSVEVVVWLEQMRHNEWHKLTRALFLMAARDPTNSRAAPVNAIEPANEEERKILIGGEARKKRRYMLQTHSLLKMIPTDEEQKIVHDLFIRTMASNEISLLKRTLPLGCAWMENSTLSNTVACGCAVRTLHIWTARHWSNIIFSHPENRNLHNKVFGGFLMRQAVELSWALAYLFSKYRPELKHISDINFHKPIEVNSLIRMHAHVVYTQMQFVQITVYAESFEARTGVHNTTNIFHFTYELTELAPEVIPCTYQEAMMYLDGRRHFLNALNQQVDDSGVQPGP